MKMLEAGTYIFKGLFMVVDQELLDKKLQPIPEEFGAFEIKISEDADVNTLIDENIMRLNRNLPNFLKFKNIKRWIPYRTSSYDIEGNIISIGYYHNQVLYDIIYKTQYTIEPLGIYPSLIGIYNEIIYNKSYTPLSAYPEIDHYYYRYGLDIYAKEIYMNTEEASLSINNNFENVLNNYQFFSNQIIYLNYH